jgi:hypothetical protein
MCPIGELGTIRSLTETEGHGLLDVETSKVAANYGAILKAGMTFIRLGHDERQVRF